MVRQLDSQIQVLADRVREWVSPMAQPDYNKARMEDRFSIMF